MKITRKNKKNISFADSGALSDLAFLLIVFFIVIAVFNVNVGFMLGLPQKSSSKIVHVDDLIKVYLKEDSRLLYNENEINMTDLEKIIKDRLNQRPNMTFMLYIKPDVPYQAVVRIMDVVQKLNVENFSFQMDQEP
jgi:biopolymer transport protein ExbD